MRRNVRPSKHESTVGFRGRGAPESTGGEIRWRVHVHWPDSKGCERDWVIQGKGGCQAKWSRSLAARFPVHGGLTGNGQIWKLLCFLRYPNSLQQQGCPDGSGDGKGIRRKTYEQGGCTFLHTCTNWYCRTASEQEMTAMNSFLLTCFSLKFCLHYKPWIAETE